MVDANSFYVLGGPYPNPPCFAPGCKRPGYHACGFCDVARYCGPACQKAHWDAPEKRLAAIPRRPPRKKNKNNRPSVSKLPAIPEYEPICIREYHKDVCCIPEPSKKINCQTMLAKIDSFQEQEIMRTGFKRVTYAALLQRLSDLGGRETLPRRVYVLVDILQPGVIVKLGSLQDVFSNHKGLIQEYQRVERIIHQRFPDVNCLFVLDAMCSVVHIEFFSRVFGANAPACEEKK